MQHTSMRLFERDKDVNEIVFFLFFLFFVRGPLLLGYLGAINVYVKEKKRESVNIENFNYRQQKGGNFDL